MEERILKLEMKVERLESLVNALVSKITMDKAYADADINGCRKATSDITPVIMTEKGYIQNRSVRFNYVPKGNITVFCEVPYTLYQPEGCTWLEVRFEEPLTKVIEVTISILQEEK